MRPPGNGAGRAAGTEEDYSLNNNSNRNNNRRRGRGNRNQGGGGGQQQNRIDSRARGNAPQLLDKYKKLAQDAQHNGDRVQAEYYLQFADHYFRVIADNKARQDEARGRRDERDDYDDESGDYGSDDGMEQRSDQGGDNRRRDNNPRRQRPRRDDYDAMDRGAEGDEFTADENPFAREERPARPERPARSERAAREDRPAGDDRAERRPRRRAGGRDEASAIEAQPAALDMAVLPPSISTAARPSGDDEPPKPRLKPRRRKPAGEAEAAVETVDS